MIHLGGGHMGIHLLHLSVLSRGEKIPSSLLLSVLP